MTQASPLLSREEPTMKPTVVHYCKLETPWDFSACGAVPGMVEDTDKWYEVTCKSCLRTLTRNRDAVKYVQSVTGCSKADAQVVVNNLFWRN